MWQHVDLRELYRKAGYKESHFIIRPMLSRNSSGSILQSPTSSANNTLSRPMSTQSGTKYEDRTLPRGAVTATRDITQIYLQRVSDPITIPKLVFGYTRIYMYDESNLTT